MNSNKNIKYYDIAISNENSKKTFYLNNFFAPAGSSLGKLLKSDKKWNLSRKIFVQFFKMFKLEKVKDFSEFETKTATLDSFCKDNNIGKIDILKKVYMDMIKAHSKSEYMFGIDAFHFQNELFGSLCKIKLSNLLYARFDF